MTDGYVCPGNRSTVQNTLEVKTVDVTRRVRNRLSELVTGKLRFPDVPTLHPLSFNQTTLSFFVPLSLFWKEDGKCNVSGG